MHKLFCFYSQKRKQRKIPEADFFSTFASGVVFLWRSFFCSSFLHIASGSCFDYFTQTHLGSSCLHKKGKYLINCSECLLYVTGYFTCFLDSTANLCGFTIRSFRFVTTLFWRWKCGMTETNSFWYAYISAAFFFLFNCKQ